MREVVLISESPGDDHGAIGVVTLEDVIEELIGEYVRNAVRRQKYQCTRECRCPC